MSLSDTVNFQIQYIINNITKGDMMKIHRAVLRDKENKALAEIRFKDGLLYKQNRSHDVEISFECFIDLQLTTKEKAKDKNLSLDCSLIENTVKWEA